MGKNSKGNRTKNNARPSSSARSAELLGNQAPTFFGLGTFKDGTLIPSTASTNEIENVDVNFQLALKKMGKKDSTTKLKALQEFSELCNKASEVEVKAILPFWPRLYGQLCGDTEHRVREAAHISHRAVIVKVKKQLAPYLKEIIGPWYAAQYDTYPPASSAAISAFQEAFPPHKLAEAVAFCQEEILNYFCVNVTVHTPQTLSNPKTNTAEEMEDKYRRVVSSSLLAYASYLQKVPADRIQLSEESNKKIASSPKFWKLCQHKDPVIRHAFLMAFISLSQHAAWLLKDESARVAGAIFSNLSEDDPLVLPVIWDAVLHGVIAIPECWNSSSVESQLLPKLFQILRSGGKGHACNIFPKILPLLSALPSEKVPDKGIFMDKLFSSMRAGLLEPSVNKSLSESKVVAATFIESIQYLAMVNRENTTLVEMMIKDQLFASIESAMDPRPDSLHTTIPLYTHAAQMLKSWYKNSPSYDHAIGLFWSNLKKLFDGNLSKALTVQELKDALKKQTIFLDVCKLSDQHTSKSQGKVRFLAPEDAPTQKTKSTSNVSVPEFDAALLKFSQNMSGELAEKLSETSQSSYLEALLDLGKCFGSQAIFKGVSDHVNLFELFSRSLESNIPQSLVVNFGLQMLSHLPNELQENVVEKLTERSDVDLELLCRGLLVCSSERIKVWMKGTVFSNIFLNLVEDFVAGMIEKSDHPLCGFLVPAQLISDGTYTKMLEIIYDKIQQEDVDLKKASALLDATRGSICKSEIFQKIVIRVFCLSCSVGGEDYSHLLRTVLMKLKFFAHKESWTELASKMAENLYNTDYDVKRVAEVVQKLVEIALDVDLSVDSDAEEIKEAIPLVRVFLEPPESVWSTGLLVRQMAITGAELAGECFLTYFELPNPENTTSPSKLKEASEYELVALSDDPDLLIAYRRAHVLTRKGEPSTSLTISSVEKYISWLKLIDALLMLILNAYPIRSNIIDTDIPGRYCVRRSFKIKPKDLEDDVVSWDILTEEEYEEIEVVRKLCADLSEEEYPDQNLIVPLGNCVLDLLEGAASLCLILKHYPEIKCYPVISRDFEKFSKKIAWTIHTGTPKEFDFIYKTCKALVANVPQWCVLMPPCMSFLMRRFRNVRRKANTDAILLDVTRGRQLIEDDRLVLKLVALVRDHAHLLTLEHWNDVFIQLDKVLKNLQKPDGALTDGDLRQVAAVSSFFLTTKECFFYCLDRNNRERLLPELIKMWNDVVEKELWCNLFVIWRSLLPRLLPDEPGQTSSDKKIHSEVAIRRLCCAVVSGLNHRISQPLDDTLNLAEQLARLLMSPNAALQITAYKLLQSLTADLVEADAVAFQNALSDEKSEDNSVFTQTRDCDWTLKRLASGLVTSQSVVEALLSGFKPGDTCTVEPYTDAFTYTHGYLLLCLVLLDMCAEAHVALRFQFGAWLGHNGHLQSLLGALFNLMPAHVVHGEVRDSSSLFSDCETLQLDEPPTSVWIEQRACYLYRQCLQWLPAAVRKWYSELDHNVSAIVAGATSAHVSPILIQSELKAVQSASAILLDNIKIAVSLPAREVVGTYVIDEASMSILISLPTNYPLGTIKVDFNAQNVMPRAWKISMFLIHRNGSLRDALALWKSDLDKRFEGVDECEICFAILNGPNFDLPNKSCSTCKKKFHSVCLYKWFHTSNKSSCPHCRNQF